MDIKKNISKFRFIRNTVKKFVIKNNIVNFCIQSNFEKTFDIEYKITDLFENDNEWNGLLELYITVSIEHKEEKKKNASLYLAIEGFFSSDKQTTSKEEFEKMLSLNGCATLYSVSRAIIMTTSSQIFNAGNITLPMVNIIKLKQERQGDNQQLKI